MGTRAMGSQSGGGQQSHLQNLPRQGSLYNLRLNEVQSHLGEPLHSMNLDELIRNVLPGDGDQPLELDLENASREASGSGLQHQGSVKITRALSKKTVEEVWRDIQQGQGKSGAERVASQERQPTVGEMTLEDFLAKDSVVTEGLDMDKNAIPAKVGASGSADPGVGGQGYAPGVQWLQPFNQIPTLGQPAPQAQPGIMGSFMPSHAGQLPSGNILGSSFPDSQMMSSSPMGPLSDNQTFGRKRAPGDVVEKTVERRQKRMIKNRESAARSRARKQAYTNELEIKVKGLEEENERLKKQQELDKILYAVPRPEPKFQLRRTSSSPI